MARLLVVTSVHPPDDPRIRHKLIASLARDWEIAYATGDPGPTDDLGLTWVPLRGGRLRRTATAWWLILRGRYDVASLHDPELLPAAILAALFRRRVVFDLHEDLPAQLRVRLRTPRPLRRVSAAAGTVLLRIAEKTMPITLAEESYATLFRRPHLVIPNLLEDRVLPDAEEGTGIVCLGDVTEERGAGVLIDAVSMLSKMETVHLIGRCRPALEARLARRAQAGNVDIRFHGYLDRSAALRLVATSQVGVAPLCDLPNYRESLPTKILEYLAVGIPVVASDLPATSRVVGDLPGVQLVTPGDAAALAEALTIALADATFASAAQANSHRVRDRFRWPSDEVHEFYASLLRS